MYLATGTRSIQERLEKARKAITLDERAFAHDEDMAEAWEKLTIALDVDGVGHGAAELTDDAATELAEVILTLEGSARRDAEMGRTKREVERALRDARP